MKMRMLFAVAMVLTLSACGSDYTSEPGSGSITGTWTGGGGQATYSLSLQQSGTTVSGAGTVTTGTTRPVTISGSHSGSAVSFTLVGEGILPLTFTGTVTSATTMTGNIKEGNVSTALSLTKK